MCTFFCTLPLKCQILQEFYECWIIANFLLTGIRIACHILRKDIYWNNKGIQGEPELFPGKGKGAGGYLRNYK